MKGIGTDIVQISRIIGVYEQQSTRFIARILTDKEQVVFCERGESMNFLANRFAAKEAVSKALGTGIAGGIRFTDIEILPMSSGEPQVFLHGQALARLTDIGATEVRISLSDEEDYAVAFAVVV
ncbi:holo-ACP synthase [Reinekea blandensis]|uniref:Holo-[acyl-carrier-protein] synthase n=1 Tax=Reinekea blandensis MED297 TaxID=314283 RepID=A4BBK1_9GAMM|nr:holo-ACP synthase [Reinekea blandensis]EAR10336.1 4'-phosphopantetheinyl transferase [Reinekea sp. MED297] [Reinekea blandensis MED297]